MLAEASALNGFSDNTFLALANSNSFSDKFNVAWANFPCAEIRLLEGLTSAVSASDFALSSAFTRAFFCASTTSNSTKSLRASVTLELATSNFDSASLLIFSFSLTTLRTSRFAYMCLGFSLPTILLVVPVCTK